MYIFYKKKFFLKLNLEHENERRVDTTFEI